MSAAGWHCIRNSPSKYPFFSRSIEVSHRFFSIIPIGSRWTDSAGSCRKSTSQGMNFMKFDSTLRRIGTGTLLVLFACAALGSTGCTVSQNGMTLPNPHYIKNIPGYYPRGTEFPFPNEAANLQDADRDFQHGH